MTLSLMASRTRDSGIVQIGIFLTSSCRMNLLVRCQRAFNATSVTDNNTNRGIGGLWSTREELKDTEANSSLLIAKAWKTLKASGLGRWISYLFYSRGSSTRLGD